MDITLSDIRHTENKVNYIVVLRNTSVDVVVNRGSCWLSILDFQKKKRFFKRFQFKKKKVLSQEKKFFLHQQFQILELKMGFALTLFCMVDAHF